MSVFLALMCLFCSVNVLSTEFILGQNTKYESEVTESFVIKDVNSDTLKMKNFEFYAVKKQMQVITEPSPSIMESEVGESDESEKDESEKVGDLDSDTNDEQNLKIDEEKSNEVEAVQKEVAVISFEKQEIKNLRNVTLIVNFWNVWSSDSIVELQELDKLSRILKELEIDQSVRILPIAITKKEDYETITKLYSEYNVKDLGVFVIENGDLFNSLNAKTFPFSIIIDSNGFNVAEAKKPLRWSDNSIVSFIKSIVKSSADKKSVSQVHPKLDKVGEKKS